MYRFSMTRMQSCQLLALTVAVVLSSGCCISPYNNQFISSYDTTCHGFTLKPNETIKVQARNPYAGWDSDGWVPGEWTTIAVTRSGNLPLPGFDGINYYFWTASGWTSVEIPEYCWHDLGIFSVTNVRCIDSTGMVLLTLEDTWESSDLTIEDNPLDAWLEHGNRDDFMTLYSR